MQQALLAIDGHSRLTQLRSCVRFIFVTDALAGCSDFKGSADLGYCGTRSRGRAVSFFLGSLSLGG